MKKGGGKKKAFKFALFQTGRKGVLGFLEEKMQNCMDLKIFSGRGSVRLG